MLNTGRAHDANGTLLRSDVVDPFFDPLVEISRDGRTLIGASGTSPVVIEKHALDVSDVSVPVLRLGPNTGVTGHALAYQPSNTQDIALNPSASILFTASGDPYLFPGYSTVDFTLARSLPGTAYPSAIHVDVDGRVFGGAQVLPGTNNFFVYYADGSPKLMSPLGGTTYPYVAFRQIAVTGDGYVAAVIMRAPGSSTPTRLEFVPVGP